MGQDHASQRALQCDFPGCRKRYVSTPGAVVAIKQVRENLAFCEEHATRLLAEGVLLRSLEEIHEEDSRAADAASGWAQAENQNEAERQFILSLKG